MVASATSTHAPWEGKNHEKIDKPKRKKEEIYPLKIETSREKGVREGKFKGCYRMADTLLSRYEIDMYDTIQAPENRNRTTKKTSKLPLLR